MCQNLLIKILSKAEKNKNVCVEKENSTQNSNTKK